MDSAILLNSERFLTIFIDVVIVFCVNGTNAHDCKSTVEKKKKTYEDCTGTGHGAEIVKLYKTMSYNNGESRFTGK